MTTLTLLSPAIVDLHTVSGAALAAPEESASFWNLARVDARTFVVEELLDGTGEVTFPEVSARAGVNLYRSLQSYSGETEPHLFSGWLPAHYFRDVVKQFALLGPSLELVRYKAYDHGIVLIESACDVSTVIKESQDLSHTLDEIEDQASRLGEAIARTVVLDVVQPLIDRLKSLPRAGDVLDLTERPFGETDDLGSPMWVTRTLTLSRGTADTEALVRHWLRNAVDSEDAEAHVHLTRGEARHHVRWVNYVFTSTPDQGIAFPRDVDADVWAGLEFAQYFYGALDRVDSLLSEVLARSADTSYQGDLASMRRSLRTLSQRAELIIMDRQRVSKYLNRRVRAHLDAIMDGWHYATVLEEPVRFKIELCTRRLDDLRSRRQARSALVTDIILLLIGVTSILATALSLSDFGRSMATNVEMGSFDLGSSRLTTWFAGLPADTLLLSSALLSLLLVVSYAAFRGDADS